MADNLNNNQLDFYRNQIQQNQVNQANIVMRLDRREVSFEIDQNFLQSSLNRFLEQNFQRIQNSENNNQSLAQFHNIIQILGQEINNIRNDLTQAFTVQEEKINNINENNNKVNEKCFKFFEEWQKENEINKKNLNKVHNQLNENNTKIEKEINNQSKKLEDSILNNNLNNDNIKSEFEILKSNLNLALNKNDGNQSLIKSLTEACNDNNKRIIELENKLSKFENEYNNNNEISKIKTNLNDFESKIKNNFSFISDLENKITKNKQTNDNNIKDLKEKINETNEQSYNKFEEITKEINKMKNELINKKFESIKIKNDKLNSDILDNLKSQLMTLLKIIIKK